MLCYIIANNHAGDAISLISFDNISFHSFHWDNFSSDVFAAPAFFFITPSCYEKLGRPSCMPKRGRADVAQELSDRAEELGIRYHILYPNFFEKESV